MKYSMRKLPFLFLSLAACCLGLAACHSPAPAGSQSLDLTLRRLKEINPQSDQWRSEETRVRWNPAQTAVVICDMWDTHWCKGAAARVQEMAPRMNAVISALRSRGVLIIHCPSDTMKFYQGQPGRALAQSAPAVDLKPILESYSNRGPAVEPPLPVEVDPADGGCDDVPKCTNPNPHGGPWPWRHEIATLEIQAGDAITQSSEAYFLMRQRGITNVILMGVHENMCVLVRPFGIRQMVRLGQNVVLMRDLTDSLYNSQCKPFVNHFIGTDLICWHIEKYWCPTITSDQILGGQPFRFAADAAPARVFHN